MIISIRKWWERAKFVALFFVFTFLIYHFMHVVSSWMTPHHRFEEPSGQAVKANVAQADELDGSSFGERLRFFYWYGE